MSADYAKRLESVQESITLKLNAMAQKLRADGQNISNLTAGEPDLPVHPTVLAAIQDALLKPTNRYTPTSGILPLRTKVAQATNIRQPVLSNYWKAENAMLTNGGKQALFNGCFALLNRGDEVLIPAPFWLSYPEMVRLCDATPIEVYSGAEQNYLISPAQLRAALSPRTKIIFINSPSNPTGAMYSPDQLRELGKVLREFPNVWIFSDEIYEEITFGDVKHVSFLQVNPDLRDRTVTFSGLSKSSALTGWRIGWAVGPREVIEKMALVQGQCTSGINSLAQWASLAALDLPFEYFEDNRQIYLRRRKIVLDELQKSTILKWGFPSGAFYFFINVKKALRPGESVGSFCEALLSEASVAVVPGDAFGDPNAIRISFALSDQELRTGCMALVEYCENRNRSSVP